MGMNQKELTKTYDDLYLKKPFGLQGFDTIFQRCEGVNG